MSFVKLKITHGYHNLPYCYFERAFSDGMAMINKCTDLDNNRLLNKTTSNKKSMLKTRRGDG